MFLVTCSEDESLATNQEEADAKVFLCTEHAQASRFTSVGIENVDSDIPIYAFYFSSHLSIHLYINYIVQKRRRVIDVRQICSKLGINVCLPLLALHAFTGNDYTSSFVGKGKSKPLQHLIRSDDFQNTFSSLGSNFEFDPSIFGTIEKFVCALYSVKCGDTNEARYRKFCGTKKTPLPEKLPPTRDTLLCHCKRVSHATTVVKRSLENHPTIPSPDGYGWKIDENGNISIEWQLLLVAPDSVLEMISCNCSKSKCRTQACTWLELYRSLWMS